MRLSKLLYWLLLSSIVLGFVTQAWATSVLQMNLDQLTEKATAIYRGTVIEARQTTVQGGGGDLPAVHYRVEVTEVFKGDVPTVMEDVPIAEFKILGNAKAIAEGRVMEGFPLIQSGKEYLLFISQAGPIGLTSTMGLAQGCFAFVRSGGEEMVVNGFNNMDLFKGMDTSMPANGPVGYSDVAAMIYAKLGYLTGGRQ